MASTPRAARRRWLARLASRQGPRHRDGEVSLTLHGVKLHEVHDLSLRRVRAVAPTSAPRTGQVAPPGPHDDRAPAPEVAHRHLAALDLGERSVAAVNGRPHGAAHGRRRVAPTCAEAPPRARAQAANASPRPSRCRGAARAPGSAALEAPALEPQVGEPLGTAFPRLKYLKQAAREAAGLGSAKRVARGGQAHGAAAGVQERADRDLPGLLERDEANSLLGGPRGTAASRNADQDRATRDRGVHGLAELGGRPGDRTVVEADPRHGTRGLLARDTVVVLEEREGLPGVDHGSPRGVIEAKLLRTVHVPDHLPGGVTREDHLVVGVAARAGRDRAIRRAGGAAEEAEAPVEVVEAGVAGAVLKVDDAPEADDRVEPKEHDDRVGRGGY